MMGDHRPSITDLLWQKAALYAQRQAHMHENVHEMTMNEGTSFTQVQKAQNDLNLKEEIFKNIKSFEDIQKRTK